MICSPAIGWARWWRPLQSFSDASQQGFLSSFLLRFAYDTFIDIQLYTSLISFAHLTLFHRASRKCGQRQRVWKSSFFQGEYGGRSKCKQQQVTFSFLRQDATDFSWPEPLGHFFRSVGFDIQDIQGIQGIHSKLWLTTLQHLSTKSWFVEVVFHSVWFCKTWAYLKRGFAIAGFSSFYDIY